MCSEYCTHLTVLCLDQHNYGVMISSSRMNNNLAGDSLCLCTLHSCKIAAGRYSGVRLLVHIHLPPLVVNIIVTISTQTQEYLCVCVQ